MAFEQTSLRKGGRGRGVQTLQRHLIRDDGSVLQDSQDDGYFRDSTEAAVRTFQSKHSDLAVDGVAGPATQARLISVNQYVGGEQGEGVRMLQEALNLFTINIAIDGSYGPETTEGVRTFQNHNAIQADGYAGIVTLDTLDKALNVYWVGGTRTGGTIYASVVRMVQSQLIEAGFEMSAGIDGDFGAQTEQAVRDFQEDNSLAVDGIAGPQTMQLLNLEADQWPEVQESEDFLDELGLTIEIIEDNEEYIEVLETSDIVVSEMGSNTFQDVYVLDVTVPDEQDLVIVFAQMEENPNFYLTAFISKDDRQIESLQVVDAFGDLVTDAVTIRTIILGDNGYEIEERETTNVDVADLSVVMGQELGRMINEYGSSALLNSCKEGDCFGTQDISRQISAACSIAGAVISHVVISKVTAAYGVAALAPGAIVTVAIAALGSWMFCEWVQGLVNDDD